jgi:hypothetical protein
MSARLRLELEAGAAWRPAVPIVGSCGFACSVVVSVDSFLYGRHPGLHVVLEPAVLLGFFNIMRVSGRAPLKHTDTSLGVSAPVATSY